MANYTALVTTDTFTGSGSAADTISIADGTIASGDTFNAGNGLDEIELTTVGATVDLTPAMITSVELISGTIGNDTLTLSGALANAATIALGAGANDTVIINTTTDFTYSGVNSGVENFIIVDNGSAHVLAGSSAAERIIGNGGADTMSGNGGNDVFFMNAGDMVSGESINGGTETDTIQLGSGVHSFAGVTVSNVEQIALTGTGDTTVTLSSAAQALLFTSSAGSNDTVIFSGDFLLAQLDALAAAGIEHVQFVSNGNSVQADYIAGVLRKITLDDTNTNDIWTSVIHTRDASDVLTSLETNFDNGISEAISFTGGLKATVERVDNSVGNNFNWVSQVYTYDSDGTNLASLLQTQDNGDTLESGYTGGLLTHYQFTDVSNSSALATFTHNYNSSGQTTLLQSVYDNGMVTTTNFSDGVRTNYHQTAATGDTSYASLDINYALDGITAQERVYTYDNGNKSVTALVSGLEVMGGAGNDALRGATGADSFVFQSTGGNDSVSNFEDGVDTLDLSAFGYASFAEVLADTRAMGANGIYISFADGGHAAITGLSLANFDASDVTGILPA